MTGRLLAAGRWIRRRQDRPFVILYAHLVVVLLYLTGRSVSTVPFRHDVARTALAGPLLPVLHAAAAALLAIAIVTHRRLGLAAGASFFAWSFTTVALLLAAADRVPRAALWAPALSSVIAFASFLMLVRWRTDGDEREDL